MVPFFGPLLSWAPPVVVAVLTKPEVAILVLIVMLVGWFIVNNIVVPRVMSQAVGIHPIVVLISVIIGLKIAGIAGAIFALPFAAVIASFFHYFVGLGANEPRDVTSRAAKRVGEREGRRGACARGAGGRRHEAADDDEPADIPPETPPAAKPPTPNSQTGRTDGVRRDANREGRVAGARVPAKRSGWSAGTSTASAVSRSRSESTGWRRRERRRAPRGLSPNGSRGRASW